MLRIITANLNGIRSAAKKGFFEWVKIQSPDILCIQELKAQEADLDEALLAPHGYHGIFQYAQKKGYSGVGLYSKQKPDHMKVGIDEGEFDNEGRYVEARFGKLIVISAYFPSGSSAPERQDAKFRFLDIFMPHIKKLKAEGLEIVLCGDINIAHHENDLKNWKGNIKNSGFLPEERDWMTKLFDGIGLVDVYRHLHLTPLMSVTHGGAKEGKPMRKMLAGELIIKLRHLVLLAKPRDLKSLKQRSFQIMRRLLLITS